MSDFLVHTEDVASRTVLKPRRRKEADLPLSVRVLFLAVSRLEAGGLKFLLSDSVVYTTGCSFSNNIGRHVEGRRLILLSLCEFYFSLPLENGPFLPLVFLGLAIAARSTKILSQWTLQSNCWATRVVVDTDGIRHEDRG